MSPWRISGLLRNDGLFVIPAWLNNQPFKLLFGFHGLIGMDFLRQYRFTVEPDTATLILRPLRK